MAKKNEASLQTGSCKLVLRGDELVGDYRVLRLCPGEKPKDLTGEGPYDMALLDFADQVLRHVTSETPSPGVRNQAINARKAIRSHAGNEERDLDMPDFGDE